MLNMLIALISESHGDVMKLEKQAERYEKLHLIINSYQVSLWRLLSNVLKKRKGDSEGDSPILTEKNFVKYCSFLRYEEHLSVELAEKQEEKKKFEIISQKLEEIKEQMMKN